MKTFCYVVGIVACGVASLALIELAIQAGIYIYNFMF